MPMLQLNDAEIELVNEALHRLTADKRAALAKLDELPRDDPLRHSFTAHDFGIPQIEAILDRIEQLPQEG